MDFKLYFTTKWDVVLIFQSLTMVRFCVNIILDFILQSYSECGLPIYFPSSTNTYFPLHYYKTVVTVMIRR